MTRLALVFGTRTAWALDGDPVAHGFAEFTPDRFVELLAELHAQRPISAVVFEVAHQANVDAMLVHLQDWCAGQGIACQHVPAGQGDVDPVVKALRSPCEAAALALLLRTTGGRSPVGLLMVETIIAAGSHDQADVCAIEVCTPAGQQVRHLRQPGESLADLEARANPTGTWHARPMPIVHEGTAP
ncbi:MAG: hypothetical protein KAY46_03880 [Burkholderiaceae bacterium]|jgi:hypothetical protein|nr:hypothetical protein [Burkholderiaceae bacterium]MBP8306377.1 hypothetical protein [Burkholderiaceae bacterium]